MTKNVVLLGGKISSGKNVVYDMIDSNYPDVKNERIYFAQPIKVLCEKVFSGYADYVNGQVDHAVSMLQASPTSGYHEERVIEAINTLKIAPHNWYEDKTECTRMILQIVGTDVVRNETGDDTHWIYKAAEQIMQSSNDMFVITDFRFPNEMYDLQTFLDHDETTDYNIITVNVERTIDRDNDTIHGHESEQSMGGFNEWYYVIDNNSDIETLEASVVTVFNEILGIEDGSE